MKLKLNPEELVKQIMCEKYFRDRFVSTDWNNYENYLFFAFRIAHRPGKCQFKAFYNTYSNGCQPLNIFAETIHCMGIQY